MGQQGTSIEGATREQVVQFLRRTPESVAVLFISYLSGQLWAFILLAYVRSSTRANKLVDNLPAKTALGLVWFSFVLVPLHLFRNGAVGFAVNGLLDLVVPTLVIGLFLQAIVFAIVAKLGR